MISQKSASHRNHRHQNKAPPCDSRRERIGRARSRRIKPSGSKTRPATREAQTAQSRGSAVGRQCECQRALLPLLALD
eukprot:106124-Prymnesium_polylepis.1